MIQPIACEKLLAHYIGMMMLVAVILLQAVECRSQSREISNALSELQSKRISVTELDWELLNLNVVRAYEKHDDYSARPLVFDSRRQRFKTSFYVAPSSAVLGLTAKNQIEQFQVEMNGVALLLGTTLELPENIANRINLFIEADFVTYEPDGFFVIARYRDGKIHLIHEKAKGR